MKCFVLVVLLAASMCAAFAAPFENLGFDNADTNSLSVEPGPILRGTGPTEDLLPGWQLSRGDTPQTRLGLNLSLLTFGYATLVSADQSDFFGFPVEGDYALHLVGLPGNEQPFSLSQRGDIPADAQFLSYKYSGFPFVVSLNGVDLRPVIQEPMLDVFDISQFRGQTVELRLTALGPLMPTEAGSSFIDSVSFAIPEPSITTLLALAVGVLAWRTGVVRLRWLCCRRQ